MKCGKNTERDLEYLEVPTRNMISSDISGNKVQLYILYSIIRFIVQIYLARYSILKPVNFEEYKK